MRLLHGDQREFIVTGAVGEFRTGERVEVKVDPEGILTPKLARDTEPHRALLWISAAIPVTLAVTAAALLLIGVWRGS